MKQSIVPVRERLMTNIRQSLFNTLAWLFVNVLAWSFLVTKTAKSHWIIRFFGGIILIALPWKMMDIAAHVFGASMDPVWMFYMLLIGVTIKLVIFRDE